MLCDPAPLLAQESGSEDALERFPESFGREALRKDGFDLQLIAVNDIWGIRPAEIIAALESWVI